jgi:hypothetical protein
MAILTPDIGPEEITFPPELARDADAATVFLAYPLEAMG